MSIKLKKFYRGKIIGFFGSWGSGLATLHVEHNDGTIETIPCKNELAIKLLKNKFSNIVRSDGGIKYDGEHVGKEILYSIDKWGNLISIDPIDR